MISDNNQFKFRRTTPSDLKDILSIIVKNQAYFKEQGINQWQNGYPNELVLINDIAHGESYILEHNNQIIATTVISFHKEPTYSVIKGQWITDTPYAVIHRIAVAPQAKGNGAAKRLFDEAEKICKQRMINSLRIDTHPQNKSMIRAIEKQGFVFCGIIHLTTGDERVAYEKVLNV